MTQTITSPPIYIIHFQENDYFLTNKLISIMPYQVVKVSINFSTIVPHPYVIQLVKNSNIPHLVKFCDYLIPESDKTIMFCLANTTEDLIKIIPGTVLGILRWVHASSLVDSLQGQSFLLIFFQTKHGNHIFFVFF